MVCIVLVILSIDNNGRSIRREHRPMGIFQEPPPDLDHINDQEDAPDIPNRVLYYLAVVMSDPQMSQLIVTLHVCLVG